MDAQTELNIYLATVAPNENTAIMLNLFGDKYRPKLGVTGADVTDEANALSGASREALRLWWGSLTEVQKKHVAWRAGDTPAAWIKMLMAHDAGQSFDVERLKAEALPSFLEHNGATLRLLKVVDPVRAQGALQNALEVLAELLTKP